MFCLCLTILLLFCFVGVLIIRVVKDYDQKLSSIQIQKEKTKETFNKEFDQFNARRNDLDRQLDSMQSKYKVMLESNESNTRYHNHCIGKNGRVFSKKESSS